jgi:hypothetical protein
MIKEFYDFNHNQDLLDITDRLDGFTKKLNPNIEVKLLDQMFEEIEIKRSMRSDKPSSVETEFSACIGLSITYTPKSRYAFNQMESRIPRSWPKHPTLIGIATWEPDNYQYISHEWSLSLHHQDIGCFRINSSTKTPDITTIKGRLNPDKKYEVTLDIALEATASTKYGLKVALETEILNKINELNDLDDKLAIFWPIWGLLIEAKKVKERGIK